MNDDVVVILEQDILFHFLAVSHFFVVVFEGLITAKNNDTFLVGKLFEALRLADRLQDPGGRDQRKLSGTVHLTIDVVFLAANFLNRDRDVGMIDISAQLLGQVFGQLNGR